DGFRRRQPGADRQPRRPSGRSRAQADHAGARRNTLEPHRGGTAAGIIVSLDAIPPEETRAGLKLEAGSVRIHTKPSSSTSTSSFKLLASSCFYYPCDSRFRRSMIPALAREM